MHRTPLDRRRLELNLLDPENPRSLVFLVPEPLARRIRALWDSDQKELLGLAEKKLIKQMTLAGHAPGPIDHRLRVQFWLEYERSTAEVAVNRASLDMAYILGHHMSKEVFYANYITNNYRLAFMLNPPFDFEASVKVSLEVCHDAVLETLQRLGGKSELSLPELRFLQTTYDKFLTLSGHGAVVGVGTKRGPVAPGGEKEPEETEETKVVVEEGGDIHNEMLALSQLSEQVEI